MRMANSTNLQDTLHSCKWRVVGLEFLVQKNMMEKKNPIQIRQ